jgi:hypothetical protein
MDPMDREILALRHFEELTNGEAAEVLGLSKTAANNLDTRRPRAAASEPSVNPSGTVTEVQHGQAAARRR